MSVGQIRMLDGLVSTHGPPQGGGGGGTYKRVEFLPFKLRPCSKNFLNTVAYFATDASYASKLAALSSFTYFNVAYRQNRKLYSSDAQDNSLVF